MSFISYIIKNFYKIIRKERIESKIPCKFYIYDHKKDKSTVDVTKLKDGVIINYDTKGYGIITSPAYEKSFINKLKKNKNNIYIEFNSTETNTVNKLQGLIRWGKTINNVKQPYSELGILLTTVEDESKSDILNSLFNPDS